MQGEKKYQWVTLSVLWSLLGFRFTHLGNFSLRLKELCILCGFFIPFVCLLGLLCDSPGVKTDPSAPLTPTTEVLLPCGRELHTPGRSFSQIIWFSFMCLSGKEVVENVPAGEAHQGRNTGFWASYRLKKKDLLGIDWCLRTSCC